jgi:hypothetical protein
MDYQLSVKLRGCIAARAHLYGAEALILQKQFEKDFLPMEGEDFTAITPASINPGDEFVTSSKIFYELVKRGITESDYTNSPIFPKETLFGRQVYVRDKGVPESMLERQCRSLNLAQQAQEARRRYFRELEAVDLLAGHSSSFTRLLTA